MFICVKVFSTSTAQVRQKHLHCTEKAYNAGKSPVLKVFKGGLRLLPAACVALRAGPTLPRKRKILIISLQSQPTLVGRANKAEAQEAVPGRRSAAAPVANRRAPGVEVPRTTPHDTVRTRRRAERVGFLSCAYTYTIPVVTPFPHVSAHVVYAKCVCCFQTFLMCTITCSSACRFC